jgi:hypothetical protein
MKKLLTILLIFNFLNAISHDEVIETDSENLN